MTSRVDEGEVRCITQHEGFEPVVLNVHVLNIAYYNYRHQYERLNLTNND